MDMPYLEIGKEKCGRGDGGGGEIMEQKLTLRTAFGTLTNIPELCGCHYQN